MFNNKTILSVRVCLLGIIRMDKAFLTVVDAELSRTDGREVMRQVSPGCRTSGPKPTSRLANYE